MIDTRGKNLPKLTESEKSKAVAAISGEFAKSLPTYRMLESKIVQVDGVDSLQTVGEAELTVVTRAGDPDLFRAWRVRLAPGDRAYGGGKGDLPDPGHPDDDPREEAAYALNFMYDDLKTPELQTLQREVLEAFRLLERPPRFGAILMGALNGGLFGMGLYLAGILIGRLLRSG